MWKRELVIVVAAFVANGVIAAPALKPPAKKVTPLANTTWIGETAEGWAMTIRFGPDGAMNVSYKETNFDRASWKQDGDKLYWEMNNKYCEFNGKMKGDTIEGESHNVAGKRWTTKMTRVKDGEVPLPPPKK